MEFRWEFDDFDILMVIHRGSIFFIEGLTHGIGIRWGFYGEEWNFNQQEWGG